MNQQLIDAKHYAYLHVLSLPQHDHGAITKLALIEGKDKMPKVHHSVVGESNPWRSALSLSLSLVIFSFSWLLCENIESRKRRTKQRIAFFFLFSGWVPKRRPTQLTCRDFTCLG